MGTWCCNIEPKGFFSPWRISHPKPNIGKVDRVIERVNRYNVIPQRSQNYNFDAFQSGGWQNGIESVCHSQSVWTRYSLYCLDSYQDSLKPNVEMKDDNSLVQSTQTWTLNGAVGLTGDD